MNQTPANLAGRRNASTMAVTASRGQREALGPRASFVLAYERLAMLAGASRDRSVIAVAVDPSGEVVAGRRVFHGGALVVGRHELCGLRLPGPTAALRQIVALVQLLADGPRIHVRDLATRQPFRTEDGVASAAVTADGPLYLAVGEYAIWLVPSDALEGPPRRGEEAWTVLSARAPRNLVEKLPVADAPPSARLRAPTTSVARETRITHVAPPMLLDGGDAPEVSWGELRLELGARKEKRWVSAERLTHGILLGRYSRCGVLVDPTESTTSRVHALLMLLGGEVWVIDLASTNGVKRDGARIGADLLRDTDRLTLGTQVVLGWRRQRHPEA